MKPDFKIVAHASKDWEEAVKLREEILRKPLGSGFTQQELEEEKDHVQVVGWVEKELVATAVLIPEQRSVKAQRVVVTDRLRNMNLGSELMGFCESYALNNGFDTVYCHARNTAVNFYLKNGYSAEGDYFDEDGIPHLKMRKTIAGLIQ